MCVCNCCTFLVTSRYVLGSISHRFDTSHWDVNLILFIGVVISINSQQVFHRHQSIHTLGIHSSRSSLCFEAWKMYIANVLDNSIVGLTRKMLRVGDSVVLGIAPASPTSWDLGTRLYHESGTGR